ncbi:MAG: hypothetical protein IJV33_07155 [Bacteroidaceae bacterium]|nr:hypothetical protein [Bacteroidaceae bacterium]
MNNMDENELKKIFEALRAAGWEPMLCDTPVPYYDNAVMCGVPADVGDVVEDEVRMMPKEFLSMQPEFMVKVQGDSMRDAGIVEGDVVKVVTQVQAADGDIVLAVVNGEVTVKTYCEDEEGQPWLVPQNADYSAFPLRGGDRVWIIGVVKQVVKQAPRIKYRSCIQLINKAKEQHPVVVSPMQVGRAIRGVAPMVEVARQWFAVYRAMVDASVVGEDDFEGFCTLVSDEVPRHGHLPVRDELQRMATLSFAKPVRRWDAENAPVRGKRFNDYLKIARYMEQLLREG